MAGKPTARKRCASGPAHLQVVKIRVTRGMNDRLTQFASARDKKHADAWRDVIYAGLAALGHGAAMSAAA